MKTKTPLKKQQIIRIMGRFNFEKVQRHMAATNWKWHDVGIPTVEQLKQHDCNCDVQPALSPAPLLGITPAQHSRQVMSSSKDMTWATPQKWFDYLDLEFDFTIDPCCHHETAKCAKHYTPAENGLAQSWQDERVFMNPPYGRELGQWMQKAYTEARDNGALVVCFVPARVDTNWWHNYAVKGEVRYPKGRVTFAGAEAAAPFPVAIVIFRPKL